MGDGWKRLADRGDYRGAMYCILTEAPATSLCELCQMFKEYIPSAVVIKALLDLEQHGRLSVNWGTK
jgi:hypothetical protein